MTRLTYEDRAEKAENPLLRKLFRIISSKKTNLCIAADIVGIDNIVDLINKVGDHICILKIHDSCLRKDNLLDNFKKLNELKKKYNFLLFEDNKCNDNAHITNLYYQDYIDFVDLVTVCRSESAMGIEVCITQTNLPQDEPRGCLMVCQMSYSEISNENANKLLETADKNSACCGIIAQELNVNNGYRLFKATPGVHLTQTSGGLDQRYKTPSSVIKNGTDVIIVGSGIIKSDPTQWLERTLAYKEAGWSAYLDCLN